MEGTRGVRGQRSEDRGQKTEVRLRAYHPKSRRTGVSDSSALRSASIHSLAFTVSAPAGTLAFISRKEPGVVRAVLLPFLPKSLVNNSI
jgi:hypothetical protein